MARTLKALENGADPTRALQKLGNALTNKLIHPTTAAIRNAAAEDRLDQLDFIQNTYDLQVTTAEDSQAHQAGPANNHDEES
jgi:glutamyl-tRNA reductase